MELIGALFKQWDERKSGKKVVLTSSYGGVKRRGTLSKVRQTMLVATVTVNPALFCLTLLAPGGVESRSTLERGWQLAPLPSSYPRPPNFHPYRRLINKY